MGVLRFDKDSSAAVDPSRMFKDFILDSHNLFPKLFPQAFKSVVYEQGDGDAGSVRIMYFAEGNKHTCAKQRIDVLDKEEFYCKYAVFEEDNILDILDSIVYEIKFEASGNGGSNCKTATQFPIKGDGESKLEEELKGSVEQGMALFKAVEAHLLQILVSMLESFSNSKWASKSITKRLFN